jgi:hypothetical protein
MRPLLRMRNPDLTHHTLCRLLSSQADIAFTSTLGPDDWHVLAATAQREGVAPLLYYWLNQAGWLDKVPPDVQADLRQAYYGTTAINFLVYRELSRILTTFSAPLQPAIYASQSAISNSQSSIRNPQSEIPVVVLKGAALAATLYPNIGLRPMGDLDLLVPKERLAEATARLEALGYVEPYPDIVTGFNALFGHHVHLQGGQDIHLAVELHWTLVGSEHDWRSPSLPWFWTQTEEWKMENGGWKREDRAQLPTSNLQPSTSYAQSVTCTEPSRSIHILTPTAHLLYLCAHLMLQHGEARSSLRWFYDIYLLVKREGQRIQWDELVARAREFRWAPAVYAALKGARDRFRGSLAGEGDTWLPPAVLEALAETSDLQASQLIARRAERLQTRATRTLAAASALSPRACLRFLLAIAVPSPVYVRWRYKPRPSWLWPLCYLYRWLDILHKGLATLWRMANSRWRRAGD